jgi:FkbM family methyltransferase
MNLSPDDYQRSLQALKPSISDYRWMIKLLRARANKMGYFPARTFQILKRFCSPTRPYFIGTTKSGVKYLGDYRDEYSLTWEVFDGFEEDLMHFLEQQTTRRKGLYLDVGCNIGIVASSLSKWLGNEGEVWSFEPLPETVQRASATFALNDVKNVSLFPIALGPEEGTLNLFSPPGHSESVSAVFDGGEGAVSVSVPCKQLDTVMAEKKSNFESVGLIKIDVEGYELSVLRGAKNLLSQSKADVFYEYNLPLLKAAKYGPDDLAAFFAEIGNYKQDVLENDGTWSNFPPNLSGSEYVNVYSHHNQS